MVDRKHVHGLAGALLWFCVGMTTLTSTPGSQSSSPSEITTDTPEYCLRLLDRVASLIRGAPRPAPHEAVDLSTEGQRMCDHGQTRGGIMRLRKALLIMQHTGE